MERWEKILAGQYMQDYIEAHIKVPITLSMLAKTAGYSPWHSAKVFKEITGFTPFAYIRALRLSRAASQLQDKDRKIIDVAFDFVFDSHEGFTRAFSREFGMTPKAYRKNTPPRKLFLPIHAHDDYQKRQKRGDGSMNKNVNTVFVQVVNRPAKKLILKRGTAATHYFAYCEEVGCEVWDILTGIKEALYEPIGMWLPKNLQKPSTSLYVQGVEVPVSYRGEIPAGFEIIELPPCKMMVFQGPPFEDEKFEDAIEALWEVMKNYDPTIYGFTWSDEDGPRFQMAPMGYRGYMEARPVRQINEE